MGFVGTIAALIVGKAGDIPYMKICAITAFIFGYHFTAMLIYAFGEVIALLSEKPKPY